MGYKEDDPYDPRKLMDGMSNKNLLLSQKNAEYKKLSEKKAENEREHSIAVKVETLALKTSGMAVTLIPTIVKGTERVANLKYDLDVSDAVLRACLESLRDVRGAIDSYRSMLSWLKAEFERTQ